jgi:hypothetical protein
MGKQPAERAGGRPGPGTTASSPTSLAPDASRAEAASYTNRLLKAKQRVWEERDKDKDKHDLSAGP